MSDLTVEFGQILETPTVFPEEEGRLEITLTNQGNQNVEGATLNLFASTDEELDDEVLNTSTDTISRPAGGDIRPEIPDGEIPALQGTDELLGTISGVNLAAGEESTFTIDFAESEFRTPSVVSPGAYDLIAEVESNEGNNIETQFISSEGTDVVLDWNSTFLNAVQAEGKSDEALGIELGENEDSIEGIPGVAPPVVARNAAILHLAIYDAVNALSDNPRSFTFLESNLPVVPEEASQEVAAVSAAHTVLSELFVEQRRNSDLSEVLEEEFDEFEKFLVQQQDTFDQQRARSLAEIGDDPAAEQFGEQVGRAILDQRSNDGAFFAQQPYTPGTDPGDYKEIREPNPTESLEDLLLEDLNEDGLVEITALLPEWDRVTPFAPATQDIDLPPGQPAFSSPNYSEQLEEVRRFGGLVDTDVTTVRRTEEQTEIAQFWAYDRPDTFRPPGQWNEIAQEVALDEGNSLEDNALLFARLNVAMADAAVVTWDAKYVFEQLRPVTAIRNADDDNNPNTIQDIEWEPLLETPNFPDYISGHSAFGGAAAGILEDFFGTEIDYEVPSLELPGVTREYTSLGSTSSFEIAARENADSRLFGGVHVEVSNADGVEIGLDVANAILNDSDFL